MTQKYLGMRRQWEDYEPLPDTQQVPKSELWFTEPKVDFPSDNCGQHSDSQQDEQISPMLDHLVQYLWDGVKIGNGRLPSQYLWGSSLVSVGTTLLQAHRVLGLLSVAVSWCG